MDTWISIVDKGISSGNKAVAVRRDSSYSLSLPTVQAGTNYNAEASATETMPHASSTTFPSKSSASQEAKVTINQDSPFQQPPKEAPAGITAALSSESVVRASTSAPVLEETVALQGLYGEVACVDDNGSGTRMMSEAGVYGDEHIVK